MVIENVEEKLLSPALAREIYCVVLDPETLILDEAGTEAARLAELDTRKKRGRPFDEFGAQ
jgi:acetone carboxylase alpha subunit